MILNYSKSKLRDFNIYIFLGLFYFYITTFLQHDLNLISKA